MDKKPELDGPQLLKTVGVSDVIYWVNSAWGATTIQKCFANSGFKFQTEPEEPLPADTEAANTDYDDEYDDIPLSVLKLSKDIFDCDFKELVAIYQEWSTCDNEMACWERPASELLEEKRADPESDSSDKYEETNDADSKVCSTLESMHHLDEL